MKFLYHIVIFVVGLGLGLWIGVKYPAQSQNVADEESRQAARIQAAVSREKIDLLNRFLGSHATASNASANNPNANANGSTTVAPDAKAEFNQMLQDEKQKLNDATAKLGN
jgi:hypothetical protein